MTECWEEGTLRAYHDGELTPEEAERVAAHLSECPTCEALADEVAGRAMRVQGLLAALPGPEQVIWMPRRAPQPVRRWPKLVAVAAGIAAGIAIAVVWPTAKTPPQQLAVQPRVLQELRPTVVEAAAPARPPAVRLSSALPSRKPAAQRKPLRQVFLALDDEPIETGVVIRVALGDAGIPADVVFGTDGKAHAIRLVDTLTKY